MTTTTPTPMPAVTTTTMPAVVVDSREQLPYGFPNVVIKGLRSGDYSIDGMESMIAIERKTKSDLYQSVTRGRERFEREWSRLAGMVFGAVVIEASWADLLRPPPRSRVHPASVRQTLLSWSIRYRVNFFCTDDRAAGQILTHDLLKKFWKQHGALVCHTPAPEPSSPCGARVCDDCKVPLCPHGVHIMPGEGMATSTTNPRKPAMGKAQKVI